MYRKMKTHVKMGATIFIFSLLVTILFTGVLLWYGIKNSKINIEKGKIYFPSSTNYTEILENNGSIQVDTNRLMEITDYNSQLFNKYLNRLLPVSMVFLTILFFLSIGLWSLLKQLQKKQVLKVAKQLKDVVSDSIQSDDPILTVAYTELKEKFDVQLNDYKRLSAYLSHEQKNEIAILHTKLELSKNFEHLKTLDNITNNIDDVLTLSESKDAPMSTIDVSVICAEVYDNYCKIASGIVFEYNGEDDTEIVGRKRWIYRAIANILENAIKYGEGKPIILSVREKYNTVIVSVTDHGIGIEETKQEKIFNNLYRINELNKDGYGIGLSLVSHVCDLCGGFVLVESEPNKGSTFYLSFPKTIN